MPGVIVQRDRIVQKTDKQKTEDIIKTHNVFDKLELSMCNNKCLSYHNYISSSLDNQASYNFSVKNCFLFCYLFFNVYVYNFNRVYQQKI